MKEIKDIIAAQHQAQLAGKRTALATVVQVEGSSYRRPGARMLVTEDGLLTGAISGGCLEGDALRKAMLAINEQRNKIVTYDTTDEDDARFGVQLGCNGIVHILFEPIDPADPMNPVALLTLLQAQRQHMVLCTLFALDQRGEQPGTQFLFGGDEKLSASTTWFQQHAPSELIAEVQLAWTDQKTRFRDITVGSISLKAFIEVIPPAIALYVFGAGNDAMPLVAMADILGWEVHVADGRRSHVTAERFPKSTSLILQKSETALTGIRFDKRTAAVLMTHNYNYDLEVLSQITKTNCPYIGLLGPKKKMQRMLDELAAAGKAISDVEFENVYSPVGLDLGAETAEEIALSVTAEIKAVLSGKLAGSLRHKEEPIHS
ncbi:XdhC family protein [Pedobacter sp. SAFR-022]|uniref:XdhC family protein n=1 Tax=Pedobacter sp. SAFR-022 TaxID=3436861 RepID=UPI003F7D18B3